MDIMSQEVNIVLTVPDNNSEETSVEIQTQMVKGDDSTTMMVNSEVIQEHDKTRRSLHCQSLGDLILATAATEAELEQLQVMNGGA